MLQKSAWEKAVAFHGHECPGLAIGVRAVEGAKAKLGIDFSGDEELVCVTENDACGVDAVQALLGCSLGKGNLIYRGTGKQAFSFFNRKNGEGIRVVSKPFQGEMDRNQRQTYLLQANLEEIFEFKQPHYGIPQHARHFISHVCEVCGETAPEHKIRLQEGKKVCLDCFKEYHRGW